MKYNTSVDAPSPTDNINLEFLSASQTGSKYVFLGEVTFLHGDSEPCDPTPRPSKLTVTLFLYIMISYYVVYMQDQSSLIVGKLIAYQRQILVCTCPATFLNLAGYV